MLQEEKSEQTNVSNIGSGYDTIGTTAEISDPDESRPDDLDQRVFFFPWMRQRYKELCKKKKKKKKKTWTATMWNEASEGKTGLRKRPRASIGILC